MKEKILNFFDTCLICYHIDRQTLVKKKITFHWSLLHVSEKILQHLRQMSISFFHKKELLHFTLIIYKNQKTSLQKHNPLLQYIQCFPLYSFLIQCCSFKLLVSDTKTSNTGNQCFMEEKCYLKTKRNQSNLSYHCRNLLQILFCGCVQSYGLLCLLNCTFFSSLKANT